MEAPLHLRYRGSTAQEEETEPPSPQWTEPDTSSGFCAATLNIGGRNTNPVEFVLEGDESDGDGSDDGADEDGADERGAQQAANREAQQARQTKAQEASARAAKFQAQQREHVRAPAIADSGVQPWDGVSVKVAQLDESKVRCDPG